MADRKYWGWHLVLNSTGCDNSINDPLQVEKFLSKAVKELDMYPIGGPIVMYVNWPEGRGVSGVQFITTSTITFHGDADGNKVFLDVFSCKEYNVDTVLKLFSKWFSPASMTHQMIYRNA